uniref:Interferon regulatory factor 7 n=1 Tax=Chrysemys picta bellii TaxID=8478 RepID=A0A8C3II11_CHRPI
MAASESEGGSQKLRFAFWLIKQINSENYEGLRWVDRDHTQFRIPWKHTSRKDINPNDYKIFKAWAITSGKYNEKLKDLAKWKTNFRCAMRSTNMFLMVQDNSKTSEDPHKVYQYISPSPDAVAAANAPTTKNNNLRASKEDISPHSEEAPHLHHHMPQQLQPQIELDLEMLSLENPPQEMDSVQNERPDYDPGRNPPQDYTTNNSAPNVYQCSPNTLHWILQQCNLTQNGCSPQQLPWALDGGLDHSSAEVLFEGRPHLNNHAGVQSTFLSEAPAGNAVIYPTLNGLEENSYHQLANQWAAPAVVEQNGFTQPAAPLPEQHPPPHTAPSRNNTETIPPNMDVTIYYRGKPLHEVQVATSSFLFTYNNEDTTVVPGCTQVVQFPSPDELPDQKQVQFTRQLLLNTGLLLEQKHKKIYAKRLNKCKVFWALSRQLVNMAQNPEPKLLPRGTETEIFDYEVFSKELKDFKEHQRAASPDFTIYLCFGQCFSKSKPKETMLILVKLVPKFCEYFHDMVLREGASSLNSGNVSLQLSSCFNSLYDLIEQFNMQID